MRRVVITGLGIVSCLGNDAEQVRNSLYNGQSGISFNPEYAEHGLRSQVSGSVSIDFAEHIDRKQLRFMGDAAAFAYISMQQAIKHSGLENSAISNPRTGLIVGSGGGSTRNQVASIDIARAKGVRKVGPYRVTQTMGSTASACLATPFGIKGLNFLHILSLHHFLALRRRRPTSKFATVCKTSSSLVAAKKKTWTMSALFDAMGALSSNYNDQPTTASRPYDSARDGFVIAGGGGIVVLEELESARARGANILGEIVGYAATSDGYDMVLPSGEGAVRCMQNALGELPASAIDYVNTHGTSTPGGDKVEVAAMQQALGEQLPRYSSTKSLSGHSLGAAGVQELIYCLLMMQGDFIAASANVFEADAEIDTSSLVRQRLDKAQLNYCLSNSFGFGGTNGCMVVSKHIA